MDVVFNQIKEALINELVQAQKSVLAAVAWVGEIDVIKSLRACVERGIRVELMVNNDKKIFYNLPKLRHLENAGGYIYLYDEPSFGLMHSKFCIIDSSTTISGSYNWTAKGSKPMVDDMIIIRDDSKIATIYTKQFINLKRRATLFSKNEVLPSDLVHEVQITFTQYSNDSIEGNMAVLTVQEGAKQGFVVLHPPFENLEGFAGSTILGYWGAKIRIEGAGWNRFNEAHDTNYYEFVCLDPYYSKFL